MNKAIILDYLQIGARAFDADEASVEGWGTGTGGMLLILDGAAAIVFDRKHRTDVHLTTDNSNGCHIKAVERADDGYAAKKVHIEHDGEQVTLTGVTWTNGAQLSFVSQAPSAGCRREASPR